jgi:hypothetical protein
MTRLLLPALLLLGCATPPPGFEERRLDTIPDGLHVRSWRFTRDGRMAAYVRFDGPDQDCVVVNRVAGKTLSLI